MLCVMCITDSLRLTDKHLEFHKRARGGFISGHQVWVNPLQAVLQKPHLGFVKHTVSASEAVLSKYGICHTVLTAPYRRRHLKCECPCHCSGPDSEDVIGHDSRRGLALHRCHSRLSLRKRHATCDVPANRAIKPLCPVK